MDQHNEPRPVIDYENLPYLPREGIQAEGNYKYATRSLFLETARDEQKPKALWCLAEHEIFAYGKWFPSAWMVYMHATDEYDALRKICGNVRQWEHIKAMKGPKDMGLLLEDWQREQAYLQRSKLREQLTKGALSGLPGYTAAAKMLLQMIDGPLKRGRPAKPKDQPKDPGVEEDANRILQFRQ